MAAKINIRRRERLSLPTAVLGVTVEPDGSTLYASCMDGVYRLDSEGKDVRRLYAHDSYGSGALLVEPERLLVSAGYDGALIWYDLREETELRRVQAHEFWSWQAALSPDRSRIASVTGQYMAGGYEYEPAAETEPSVRVYDARDGSLLREFSHTPSVQSVAFSPDGRHLAAGNLMGKVRVWDLDGGELAAEWTTPDFTSWGIIKSHCYIGGIFALRFVGDDHLLAAGMGPMRDPMAGNGRQLWQKFAWRETPARKVDETRKSDGGEGLMETLALHPSGGHFFMGGRLRGGNWNGAFFDADSGEKLGEVKTGFRITGSAYRSDGRRLFVAGTAGQPRNRDGKSPPFGKIDVYEVES